MYTMKLSLKEGNSVIHYDVMNLKDIKLSEISHSGKQDYCIIHLMKDLGVVSHRNRQQNGGSQGERWGRS